ncbi:MAG: bifunctional hydroxymethylpyrimidine kinase/phosphomethylpyrimidine kinase [Nitrososphaeria archaeon]|nr:bifunctional hydroxymethylpyrimidine kinase/phosphomethylpyrimidine kinase [Nitrososphaeria archaeon]
MNILAIGGSDPSSGAGIQSDIKAAQVLGANCFTTITAITAQNSSKFIGAEPVSAKSILAQMDSILSDFPVDVITIGMVYDSEIIKKIYSRLKDLKIPIVLDPVIKSTTHGILLKADAISTLKRLLIPISQTITPNVAEAEILSGIKIRKSQDLVRAAQVLSKIGAKNIIITGHKFAKNKIGDFVYYNKKQESIYGKPIPSQNHGSGCNFAIALAFSIAQKKDIFESARFAKQFTNDAILSAQKLGRGIKMTNPKQDKIKSELGDAIIQFEDLEQISSYIPECQTNFVFAKQKSKSIGDIVGVSGRIVRAGKSAITAGTLEYGGSQHVATAVLMMQKKFPKVRSGLNIRYNEGIIRKFAKSGAKIVSYDRKSEPQSSKSKENSSISWGIGQAIKKSASAPDIIYHTGDYGKEPMIIVFGTTPQDVLKKISKIL